MSRLLSLILTGLLVVAVTAGCASETKDWQTAKTKNDVASYEHFLQRHPKGQFVDEARRALLSLTRAALPLDAAILGHWRNGDTDVYFATDLITTVEPEYQFSGDRMHYRITAVDPASRSVAYTETQKAVVSIAGLEGWGPVVELDVSYVAVLSKDKMSFDLYRVPRDETAERVQSGNWQYIDDSDQP